MSEPPLVKGGQSHTDAEVRDGSGVFFTLLIAFLIVVLFVIANTEVPPNDLPR